MERGDGVHVFPPMHFFRMFLRLHWSLSKLEGYSTGGGGGGERLGMRPHVILYCKLGSIVIP